MIYIITILLIIISYLLAKNYIVKRNTKVLIFLTRFVTAVQKYNHKHLVEISTGELKPLNLDFEEIFPPYQKMVYSFEKLKYENYLTKEQIEKLEL